MHLYAIYDKETGEVLQTHAAYVLGNEEPVALAEKELLAAVDPELGPRERLAIAEVPADFDPRDRSKRIAFDKKKNELVAKSRRRPSRSKKKKG
jgi:hypothetical protein